MCGLAGGMSSTLSNQEIHRIKMLMILATFRGMYGSGATVVHPGKTKTLGLTVCKTECCAAELVCEPSFVEAIGRSPKIISAHARAPTKGGNEIKNVHPHRSGHITGVHNGTMWQVMGQKIKDDESDSAAIFAGIAEHGIEAFMKESRGAYSLVWTDTKEGTLNFLRNDARPLVFASVGWANRTSTMYWSSEMGMLEFMLKRERVDTKDVRFDSPKPFQHIKFPLDVRHDIIPLSIKQYEDPVVVTAKPYHYRGAAGAASWEDTLWDYDDSQELTGDISDRIAKQKQAREAEEARLAALQKSRANLPVVRRPMSNVVTHPSVLPNVEDILKNGARRRTASESTFRPSSADDKDVAVLLRSGGCCICDDTPQVIRRDGVLIYPKVYPVKFGAGWPQYICRDCVKSNNPIALSILPSALLH